MVLRSAHPVFVVTCLGWLRMPSTPLVALLFPPSICFWKNSYFVNARRIKCYSLGHKYNRWFKYLQFCHVFICISANLFVTPWCDLSFWIRRLRQTVLRLTTAHTHSLFHESGDETQRSIICCTYVRDCIPPLLYTLHSIIAVLDNSCNS